MARIDFADGWMPLTLPQLDFWEEFSFHPDQPVSTVAHCVEIEGDVDVEKLLRAISQTVREAEVLSIRFSDERDRGVRCNYATRRICRTWILLISAPFPIRGQRLGGVWKPICPHRLICAGTGCPPMRFIASARANISGISAPITSLSTVTGWR